MNRRSRTKEIMVYNSAFVLICALTSVSAMAGEIYGRVAKDGSIHDKVKVTIECQEVDFKDETETHSNGAYSLPGPAGENECTISVSNVPNSVKFYTSSGRTRVNLDVSANRLHRR